MEGPENPGRIKDIRVYRDSFIGMCLLACTPFLIFGALDTYGWLAAIGLFLLWLVLLVQGTRWFVPHPRRVIALALLSYAAWTAAVLISRT
ncbi:MAG: hypothetical protein JWQ74_1619 [Marmoricola sp.]|nr:hypothetical protein [Marmoricola sp.]